MDLTKSEGVAAGPTHVGFPRAAGGVLLPLGERGAAAAGVCMYTASKPSAMAVQELAFRSVRLFGARAWPGTRVTWHPPVPQEAWSALHEQWRDALGGFDSMSVYQRRQADRTGLTLALCRTGNPVAIVKVRDAGGGLLREQRALTHLAAARPRLFGTPEPMGHGTFSRWHWSAQSVVFHRPHKPVLDPDQRLFEEIGSSLRGLGGHPDGPGVGHNDLTPWNLRREPRGRIWLFDWEDVGPAGERSDETYYYAARAGIRTTPMPTGLPAEAVENWSSVIHERLRLASEADTHLARRMLAALDEARSTAR